MKYHPLRCFLALWFCSCYLFAQESPFVAKFALIDGVSIQLSSTPRAKALLGKSDAFSQNLSVFDLQARMKNRDDMEESHYLAFAQEQVLDWTEQDIESLERIIAFTSRRISKLHLNLNLPAVIEIVKSSTEEEGDIFEYSREHVMVLNAENLNRESFLRGLFHIFARYNPVKRDWIYETLGFYACNGPKYPFELEPYRISRTDIASLQYAIKVQYQGAEIEVMPLLYADDNYMGGVLEEYVQRAFLVVQGPQNAKELVYQNNKPILLRPYQLDNLEELIGANTRLLIHPEEISAVHFQMLMTNQLRQPNPYIILALGEYLQEDIQNARN